MSLASLFSAVPVQIVGARRIEGKLSLKGVSVDTRTPKEREDAMRHKKAAWAKRRRAQIRAAKLERLQARKKKLAESISAVDRAIAEAGE